MLFLRLLENTVINMRSAKANTVIRKVLRRSVFSQCADILLLCVRLRVAQERRVRGVNLTAGSMLQSSFPSRLFIR